jgi:PEP-CTERM motif
MKTVLCLAIFTVAASTTTIYVDSDALSTTNSSGFATVDLSGKLHRYPDLAAALPGSEWISYGRTGDDDDDEDFSLANRTLVTFTTHFTLIGAITGAGLNVLADDSTSVILNGHTLIAANTTQGTKCSNHPVGCITSTEGMFTFAELAPYLVDGVNTLQFGVVQVARSSFGLDFAGSVDDGATPEPATVALIGVGLIALASIRRRK